MALSQNTAFSRSCGLLMIAALSAPATALGQLRVDPTLPGYDPGDVRLEGEIRSVGSETMNGLMTLWLSKFREWHPETASGIEGKGSSSAVPGLVAGTADVGPMSRGIKAGEAQRFEAHFRYPATQVKTSMQVLAVYVNKGNPIESLTLPQIDAIFSSTRRLGHPAEITTWGQLGLKGDWEDAPIRVHGANAASQSHGHFKKQALGGGAFKATVLDTPGRPVQAVGLDRGGIGYSGFADLTPGVRAVRLSRHAEEEPVPPTARRAHSGDYPLARPLLLTVASPPDRPLKPAVREFLRFVFSHEGQEITAREGLIPLDFGTAAAEARKVGIRLERRRSKIPHPIAPRNPGR